MLTVLIRRDNSEDMRNRFSELLYKAERNLKLNPWDTSNIEATNLVQRFAKVANIAAGYTGEAYTIPYNDVEAMMKMLTEIIAALPWLGQNISEVEG